MTRNIARIVAHPAFAQAQETLRAQHDRLVEEIIALTEIPAPPFHEARRAAAFRERLAAQGLEEVRTDAIGNVTGLRRGRGNGQMVVLAAHLDTVFPEGTDVTVRREGTRLYAPGIGDDTRGLAVLLAFARALDAAGIETEQDLLFVADVGEEGKGDLRGIRHLLIEGRYRDRIGAFFTLDSPEVEPVVIRAVGSHRYRITFRGPGGHSYGAFGTVNPAHVMADVVAGMARWRVPSEPRTTYCASVFGGGSAINAIPEEVWTEIDLRSVCQEELNRLDSDLHMLIAAAVEAENARGDTSHGEITVEAARLGARPAGGTDPSAPIVRACDAALAAFGFTMRPETGSTDANIPMSLGIPAVKIGTGGCGGRAHTLGEWIDVAPEPSLRGLYAGLAAILGVAGLHPDTETTATAP
ncbi:M20/M25/M40 family metallo-hydrolase [Salipiger sp. P9]|uniref:M20/M25/M40 family metallo-hydrolase n=1 Tax=Salipiger pentaromativorans TaxID=2943193 RepID=UPI002157314D|nr:M20/M25/M40 family metallo-hydrolase [Salipiger pentaromativorans]MCR8546912.1 M20/M25/M40 family metallo-hydrolase [Salipiger pentaromativorans]